MPTAGWILMGLGAMFLVLGLARLAHAGWPPHPQARAWLLVAAIFLAVSAWLHHAHGAP